MKDMNDAQRYECGICGTKYESRTTCECCGARHKELVKVAECSYASFAEYPYKITVRFEDGKVKEFVDRRLV